MSPPLKQKYTVLDLIVAQSLPFDHLSYLSQADVAIGARVVVPLGKSKHIVGVVVAKRAATDDDEKLRQIIEIVDYEPIIDEHLVELYRFVAQYYMATSGEVLRTFVPIPLVRQNFEPSMRLLKNRHKKPSAVYAERPRCSLKLTKAVTLLTSDLGLGRAEIIASLHQKGTTLVLAPTQLEAQKLAGSLSRYAPVLLYHPNISVKRRAEIFVELATVDRARIVVGTRSAVALPVRNLELVVVSDEHSYAFKSGRAPRFSGRDTALMLRSIHNCKALLISSVPSVESYFNATTLLDWELVSNESKEAKKLQSIALEHGNDMISKYLRRRIEEQIARGKQIVIFQNRRGWASAMVCPKCGFTPSCPSCNCSLTLHTTFSRLECHYCGHYEPFVEVCPQCKQAKLEAHGRGTERLEQQIGEMFPKARIARLDSDNSKMYDEISKQFATRQADIIVGTQVVIDRIDFSNVGLIAVANADNLLSIADFRASEQAFRLVYTLAQRARMVDAELIIQTSNYKNKVIKMALSSDRDAFYEWEINHRQQANYPPFARLVEIDMRSADKTQLFVAAQHVESTLRPRFVAGLSPLFQPSIERQAGDHIVKLLLRVDRNKSSSAAKDLLSSLLKPLKKTYAKTVKIETIVDLF